MNDDEPVGSQRAIEEVPMRNEELLRSFFESDLIGMAMSLPGRGFLKVNNAFCEMLGYSSSELMQLRWSDVTHPEDIEEDIINVQRLLSRELDKYTRDKRFIRKDGEILYATISIKCYRKQDGTHDYNLAFIQDITERKQIENKLRISEKRLKKEVYVKNKFFSIIAHDLKSPVISLLARTQTISQMGNNYSKEKLMELATNLNEDGNRVFKLLRNLLEWSRLQMEVTKQKPKMIQLEKLTNESIDILNSTALLKNISLTNNINNVRVFADQDMVRTVILNLITNSIKFSLPGGSVVISASNRGKMVQVTVTDTGIGMPEDQIKEVFYLDQETSTIGTAGERGTGLGLPLCKEMIERNKGEIWIESALGEETHIHFTLPIGDPS